MYDDFPSQALSALRGKQARALHHQGRGMELPAHGLNIKIQSQMPMSFRLFSLASLIIVHIQ